MLFMQGYFILRRESSLKMSLTEMIGEFSGLLFAAFPPLKILQTYKSNVGTKRFQPGKMRMRS